MASGSIFAQSAIAPNALPTGGHLAAGAATISQSGNTLNVVQASQRAVVNWDSFNVGSQAKVEFIQPNAQAVIHNRVVSATASQIDGMVKANGQVIISNASGVIFGKSAQVDVGAIVATTMDINDREFMEGKNTFKGNGKGAVVNYGKLQTKDPKGYIALLAPEVRNEGYILAKGGAANVVALASGSQVTLDFRGDQLMTVKVDASAYKSLIENKRLVQVDGGMVVIAANSAAQLMGSVIKNSGRISTSSMVNNGGVIEILADTVQNLGAIIANAAGNTGNGGQINIKGNTIALADSSKIKANAKDQGNGGQIIVLSEKKTQVSGVLEAKGGKTSGNGGFIDTSSKEVLEISSQTKVDTSARNILGKAGTWLLDPMDLLITTGFAQVISDALQNNNVTVQVQGNVCSGGSCTQNGSGNLTIDQGVTISKTGGVKTVLTFLADGTFYNYGVINQAADSILEVVIQAQNVNLAQNSKIEVNKVTITAVNSVTGYGSIIGVGANPLVNILANIFNFHGAITVNSRAQVTVNGVTSNSATVGTIRIIADELTLASTGKLEANNTIGDGGTIILSANGTGIITIEGLIQTNGGNGRGGEINISQADDIHINNAIIQANGNNGGYINIFTNSGDLILQNALIQTNGSNGRGGSIGISATNNTLISDSNIEAKGLNQGGIILIGNDADNRTLPFSISVTLDNANIDVSATNNLNNQDINQIKIDTQNDLLINNSTLKANGEQGGQIYLYSQYQDLVFDNSLIQTNGSNGRGGTVEISSNSGSLTFNSTIQATGVTVGGTVLLTADHILLDSNTLIDVTGNSGGGSVLVGGDWQGGHNQDIRVFPNRDIHQSTTVTMKDDAVIDASAKINGDGGVVVLWSDITKSDSITYADGTIYSKGGLSSGNGGRVETSAGLLQFGDAIAVSTKAVNGKDGEWLLDPNDLWIITPDWVGFNYSITGTTTYTAQPANPSAPIITGGHDTRDRGAGVTTLTVRTIVSALNSGNVRVLATGTIDVYGWQGSGISDYYINSATTNQLTLEAGSAIYLRSSNINNKLINLPNGKLELLAGTIISQDSIEGGSINVGTLILGKCAACSSSPSVTLTNIFNQITNLQGSNVSSVSVNSSTSLSVNSNGLSTTGAISLSAAGNISVNGSIAANNQAITLSATANFITNGDGSTTRRTINSSGGNISIIADSDANGSGTLDLDFLTVNPSSGNLLIRGEVFNWATNTNNAIPVLNGSGAFTMESSDASFGQGLSFTEWIQINNDGSKFSSFTLGKTGNAADIIFIANTQAGVTTSTVNVNGPIFLYAPNVSLTRDLTTSNATTGNITIVTTGNGLSGTGGMTLAEGRILSITQSGTSNYSGVIAGSSVSLTKAGTGRLNLIAANTYTGGTTVSAGSLGLYHNSSAGTGEISFANNTTLLLGRAVTTIANNIALTGSVTVDLDTTIDYLIVAGGGGGGAWVGAGGGGGGVLSSTTTTLTDGPNNVVVGAGGVGALYSSRFATSGGNSSLGSSLVATGGGHGASWTWQNGGNGGSGGGGAFASGTGGPGTGIAGQGNNGGQGAGSHLYGYLTGGGGGAGAAGGNQSPSSSPTQSGNGGAGLASSITGESIFYGGGGGGGLHDNTASVPGTGGSGGGGNGSESTTIKAASGADNTGGGGGGTGAGSNVSSEGGNGGSGIVIVRYLGGSAATAGNSTATGQATAGTGTAVGYTLHRFTAAGSHSFSLNTLAPVLSGNISGGNLIVDATGGTIALTGANTYSNTTISGGTLTVGNNSNKGSLGSGTVTNNAALILQRSDDFTVANNISGNGTLTKLGAGVATLTGTNTYAGNTTISAGRLVIGDAGTLGSGSYAGNISIANTNSGTLEYASSATQTFSGVLSGSGAVTVSGSGTLTLSGNNTYTGLTTVSNGTLTLAPSTTFEGSLGGGLVNNSNIIFDGTNGGGVGGTFFITGASGSGTWTVTGSTTGRGQYSNRVVLVGNTTISGLVTVTGHGNFWLENDGINTTSPIFLNGANTLLNLYARSTSTVTRIGALSGNGRVDAPGNVSSFTLSLGHDNGSADFSGTIVNSATTLLNLTKVGTGTQTLSGTNTYTGVTTISGGTLSVSTLANGGSDSGIGKSGNAASNLVFDGGTLAYTGAAVNTDRLFTITNNGGGINASGTGALNFNNAGSIAYTGTNARSFTLTGSDTGNNTLRPILANNTGVTSLTKAGLSTWILSGTNSYTGATTVSAGTLSINTDRSLGGVPASATVGSLILNGGTLMATADITLSSNRGISLGASGGSFSVDSTRTLTYGGIIANVSGATGTLTKTGAGTLVLSGTNSYTGATTVSAGTLSINTDRSLGAIPGSATVGSLVLNGGTLLATADITLSSNRGISLGASGGSFSVDSTRTLTYGGIIANVGGATGTLTKTGAGTLVLSGANSYTGITTITAGTLSISADANLGTAPVSATTGSLVLNGGTLLATDNFTLNSNRRISMTASSTISVDTNDTLTYGGIVNDGASSLVLTKAGAGTLVLSGANTYDGGTTISEAC
jgi:filamentous hemagglutinin family protein